MPFFKEHTDHSSEKSFDEFLNSSNVNFEVNTEYLLKAAENINNFNPISNNVISTVKKYVIPTPKKIKIFPINLNKINIKNLSQIDCYREYKPKFLEEYNKNNKKIPPGAMEINEKKEEKILN
jgi:hypothetical protein